MKKLLLTCVLSAAGMLTMAGCASPPETEYYSLRPAAAADVPAAECSVDARVRVAPFTAAEPYGGEKIVYRNKPYRVYFDDFRKWTTTPPRMVEQQCAEWLRKSDLFSGVTRADRSATYVVEGRIMEFYELNEKKQRYAVARLELSLVNNKGTTLFTIRPKYRVQAPGAEDLSGVAEAMSKAVGKALRDFVRRAEKEFCPASSGPE